MKKKDLKKELMKIWPKAKKDLENISKDTAKLLKKGESYIKNISEKTAKKAEAVVYQVKREQLYYQLGNALASRPKAKWQTNKKYISLIKSYGSLAIWLWLVLLQLL